MTNKSYCGLGHDTCPVCGTHHNETVLLDRRLRPTLDHDNHTGWSLCPEHATQAADGYVFLVELRSEPKGPSDLQSTWPLRTGNIVALRREAATSIFGHEPAPLSFCTPDLTARLQEMVVA